jgi:hypothetical protein
LRLRASLLALALLATPWPARADFLDIVTSKLSSGCSLANYLALVEEFRGVMKAQGYKYTVEIVQPFQDSDLSLLYWVGREPNQATFGEENDRWEAATAKPGTPEAKVNDKINACATNVSRTSGHTR